MKAKHPIKNILLRFCVIVALVGMLTYTLYHVAFSSAGSLLTTPAKSITDTQTLTASAYLFRDEAVLTCSEEGLLYNLVSDGSKVSKNIPLVEHRAGLSGNELAAQQSKLDSLNRVIAVLQDSRVLSGAPLTAVNESKQNAADLRLSVKQMLNSTDRYSLSEAEDALLISLNRYAALTGNAADHAALLLELQQERAAMLSSLSTTYYSTEASGYFYSHEHVDGYESLFTPQALEALNSESFDALIASLQAPSTAEGFAVGKLQYSLTWHIALRIPATQIGSFAEGEEYSASFPENNGKSLTLTCVSLIPEADGGSIAVLSCQDSPADFRYLRKQSVKITLLTTNGYYVPASALCVLEDGAAGVYIYDSRTVRWRWVVVVYEGNGYYIVEEQGGREGYLALNDLLITYGTDLYDGKVY